MLGRSTFQNLTISYGLAHFGKSLFWTVSEILFAFYITEVSRIPAVEMSWILAAGFVVGAACDLAFSRTFAGALASVEGAVRLQFIGAMACAGALSMLFLGAVVPESIRLVYALGCGVLFRIGYAAFDLPQNALLSLWTSDADHRSRVSAVRLFFSGVASLSVALSITPLLSRATDIPTSLRFFSLAVTVSLIALSTAWRLMRLGTGVSGAGTEDTPKAGTPVRHDTGLVSFWLIIALSCVVTFTVSAFGKVEPYYAAFSLKSPLWGGLVMVAVSLGQAGVQPFWSYFSLRASRSVVLCAASMTLIIGACLFWLSSQNIPVALVGAFLFGAGSGGIGMALWAAFGDALVRKKTTTIAKGYAQLTAALKVSLALNSLVLGGVLAGWDYHLADSSKLPMMMCAPAIAGAIIVFLIAVFVLPEPRKSAEERVL